MTVTSILPVIEHYLDKMALVWLESGATTVDVATNGIIDRSWGLNAAGQDSTALHMCVALDDHTDLRVFGYSDRKDLDRLKLDAGLLKDLAQRDIDLESMTIDLVENQDQLLALYDMTRSTRLYLHVPDTLQFMAQEASRLIHTQAAFASLQLPGQPLQILQSPAGFLATDALEELTRQLNESSKQEFLLGRTDLPPYLPESVHNLYVRRFPIRAKSYATIGIINKLDGEFKSPDLKLAGAIADCTAAYLENALLAQENLQQMRMQTEMEIAQKVQAQLLPTQLPQIAGLDLAAKSRPARELGGDFYDMTSASRSFTFSLGDVSGKGAPAAMLMAVTRTALRTHTRFLDDCTPAMILGRTNEDLYSDLTVASMFATVFVGQYKSETSELIYANAGHSPVMFCPFRQPAVILEADGPPLGVLDINLCEDHRITLKSGDVLVIASDGLNESAAPGGEMYGIERLLKVLTENAHLTAHDLIARLLSEVEAFSVVSERADDQTVLVVKKL